MSVWNRQPAESHIAFEAFRTYRDLGSDRSIDKAFRLARQIEDQDHRAPGNWFRWALEHQWQSRAAEYDTERDRIELRAGEHIVAEAAKRRTKLELPVQD